MSGGDVQTLGETASHATEVRASRARLAFGVALGVIVVLALAGLFGVRSASRSSAARGYRLEVQYARISRSGLSGSLRLTVTHAGGFSSDVRVAISHDYVTRLADADVSPTPRSATTSGDMLVWEFDAPAGDVLDVDVGGNFHPSVQWRQRATATVLDDDDRPIVSVRFTTTVLP